jgi:hypothetical protein
MSYSHQDNSKQESCCYEHAALQRTLQAMYVPAQAELPHITVESVDQSLCNEAFYIHGWVQGAGGEGGFIPFPLPNSAESTLRQKGLSEEELCS